MKEKAEVEKMLQQYMMKAEDHKRNARDRLWRIVLAKVRVCELILGCNYQDMLKERRKRNHEARSRRMIKTWGQRNA